MPFPGLVTLFSAPAKAALPFLRSAARKKIGADRMFQTFRTQFPGLIRREVRAIVKAELQILESRAQLKFLNRGNFPNVRRLPPSLTSIRRRFSFNVRVRATDSKTGNPIEQFVTVSTDELLTRGQIEDQALAFVEGERKRYGIDNESVLLLEGMKAGPEGVLG